MENLYKEALKTKDAYESQLENASQYIKEITQGKTSPIGLTDDGVKQSRVYKMAKAHYEKLSARNRKFNAAFIKSYNKQYRQTLADRRAKKEST